MSSAARVYQWERFGDLSGLKLNSVAAPELAADEVQVRIRASALNQRDLMVARGIAVGSPLRPGLVPLSDGAGEVRAVGSGVSRFKVGDRVAATFRAGCIDSPFQPEQAVDDLGGGRDGVLREFLNADEQDLVLLPAHLSYEEAATLPCAGVTAWNALFGKRSTGPGDRVLVLGSGGVAVFALQFAKLAGAQVIATTGDSGKVARLRSIGADVVVNYREHPEWEREVLKATDGCGVDLVVETGGAGTLPRSLRATRVGGTVVLVGLQSGVEADASIFMTTFVRDLNLGAVHVGNRRDFEAMNRVIGQCKMRPVVDRSFEFAAAAAAYEYLQAGTHVGKVVINHG